MRERSLQDIDNDIATIWKEIKEFDETTPENIEPERIKTVKTKNERQKEEPNYCKTKQTPDYESIPLPAPPLPPKSRHRSSSLSINPRIKQTTHTNNEGPPSLPPRNTSLSRSNSLPGNGKLPNLKPCIKPNSRNSSVSRCSRSRSQTPASSNKVSFKVEGKTNNYHTHLFQQVLEGNKSKPSNEDANNKDDPFEWVDFKKYGEP